MKKYFMIFTFFVLSFGLIGEDFSSILDKEVKFRPHEIENGDINFYLRMIFWQTKYPMLIETDTDLDDINLTLSKGKWKISELLPLLCDKMGKEHKFCVKNGVLLIQGESLITKKDYPLNEKYPRDIKTDSLSRWSDDINNFLKDLLEKRIFTQNPDFEFIQQPYNKATSQMTVREVLLDLLSRSRTLCQIVPTDDYKWGGDERKNQFFQGTIKATFPDIYEKNFSKNQDNLYFLYTYNHSEMNNGQPWVDWEDKGKKTESAIPRVPVLDGLKLLKVDSVFKAKDKSLTVLVENTSQQELVFKDIKNSLMAVECYSDKKVPFGMPERMLYPAETEKLPDFVLKPKEKKEISFKTIGARCRSGYTGGFVWDNGFEQKSDIDELPFETLKDLGKYIFFRPIIYFYDKDGVKYKSSGYEAKME